jgi:hypothetical protein
LSPRCGSLVTGDTRSVDIDASSVDRAPNASIPSARVSPVTREPSIIDASASLATFERSPATQKPWTETPDPSPTMQSPCR